MKHTGMLAICEVSQTLDVPCSMCSKELHQELFILQPMSPHVLFSDITLALNLFNSSAHIEVLTLDASPPQGIPPQGLPIGPPSTSPLNDCKTSEREVGDIKAKCDH